MERLANPDVSGVDGRPPARLSRPSPPLRSVTGPCRFGWLLTEELAGSGRPGRYAPLAEDLEFLRASGVGVIISLLETTANLADYDAAGFEKHHVPVQDFTPPTIEQIREVCAVIRNALGRGKKVLVHCNAGIGRTGTLLACYLVDRGEEPARAIARVREARPMSLETREQEQIVYRYGDSSAGSHEQ